MRGREAERRGAFDGGFQRRRGFEAFLWHSLDADFARSEGCEHSRFSGFTLHVKLTCNTGLEVHAGAPFRLHGHVHWPKAHPWKAGSRLVRNYSPYASHSRTLPLLRDATTVTSTEVFIRAST
jgi:hypothetical protein